VAWRSSSIDKPRNFFVARRPRKYSSSYHSTASIHLHSTKPAPWERSRRKVISLRAPAKIAANSPLGTTGQAKNFITRTQAVRKLQIALPDFRRLCIFKGKSCSFCEYTGLTCYKVSTLESRATRKRLPSLPHNRQPFTTPKTYNIFSMSHCSTLSATTRLSPRRSRVP
jgi:hypothetical protein